MLGIHYQREGMRAAFTCAPHEASAEWFVLLRRTLDDLTKDVESPVQNSFSVPWWSFLTARGQVLQVLRAYGAVYELSADAKALLVESKGRQVAFEAAKRAVPLTEASVRENLRSVGFLRDLTAEQVRNVCRIGALPAAATFSVPGAGKTTEALAYYFLRRTKEARLLVVAPKNAFTAWDEQLDICIGEGVAQFVRLRGGRDKIAAALLDGPQFSLITYQQLTRVADVIAAFLASKDTFVFLDESHRIKAGAGGPTADAALRLSHLPIGKLIMSGTPMPQSELDLVPQFSFLYPEVQANEGSIVEFIRPIYVRTTKAELGLKEPQRLVIPIQMREHQSHLYNLMKYEVKRIADQTLTIRNRQAFRALGRSVMRLLQVVSNPALLTREIAFAHEGVLMAVLGEGDSPKVEWAVQRARQLASEGKKSIIWTTFRENVEILSQRLVDLKAVFIHGQVEAGDEEDDDTREGRIRLFHDDKNTFVMVANPAAAAEGISLHTVCHNAIYVDRSYNAAHYLQSEDRIHRLGLDKDQATTIEILECVGTIDESVRMRLNAKVQAMAVALNDPSLRIDPIRFDQYEVDDSVERMVGELDEEDVHSLLRVIREDVH